MNRRSFLKFLPTLGSVILTARSVFNRNAAIGVGAVLPDAIGASSLEVQSTTEVANLNSPAMFPDPEKTPVNYPFPNRIDPYCPPNTLYGIDAAKDWSEFSRV